jgi:hypothetical protein
MDDVGTQCHQIAASDRCAAKSRIHEALQLYWPVRGNGPCQRPRALHDRSSAEVDLCVSLTGSLRGPSQTVALRCSARQSALTHHPACTEYSSACKVYSSTLSL